MVTVRGRQGAASIQISTVVIFSACEQGAVDLGQLATFSVVDVA